MAAYMIITAVVPDRAAFAASGYAAAAAAAMEHFGGRYVIRAPGTAALEGGFGEGGVTLVSEWPDRETALAYWTSPRYAGAKALREGLAEVQVLLIDAPAGAINGEQRA